MAKIEASSETDFRASDLRDATRLHGGSSHLHPGENGIAEVLPFEGLMWQAGPRLVTVMTRCEVILEDGTHAFGHTFYPHYLSDQQVEVTGMQLLRVDSVHQELDGMQLYSRVENSVAPLSASPDIAEQVGSGTPSLSR